MPTLRFFLENLLKRLSGRPSADEELRDELDFHIQMRADRGQRNGMPEQASELEARRLFGNRARIQEEVRAVHVNRFVESIGQDLRYASRVLRKSPGFTVAAVLILALGIGANTSIYQLFDAIRLRALPVEDPQQLAVVQLADITGWQGRRTSGFPVLSNPLWEQFRDSQSGFSGVLAWANTDLRLERTSDSQVARGLFISGDFFNVLHVNPLLGRVFTAADDRPGCGLPGAVVSHGFWQRELGGNPAVIGSTLFLNSQPVEVIGVTPPTFSGLEIGRPYDVAVPICSHATLGSEKHWLDDGMIWWLTVMGRRRADWSLEMINAELKAVSPFLFQATVPPNYPTNAIREYLQLTLIAVPGDTGLSALRNRYNSALVILMVTTGLVLLIACANLASLILARASARNREFAFRLAVGASRSRLIRQLMIEHALLAIGGAAVGVVLAFSLSRVLLGFLASGLSLDLPLEFRLIGFVVALAGLTSLAVGLIPAWLAARTSTADSMRLGSRGTSGTPRRFGARQILVVSQVAISLVLVFVALLFAGTLRNLLGVDPGFEPDSVAVAHIDFSLLGPPVERMALKRELLDRIRDIPGVASAAEVRHVPLGGTGSSIMVWRDDSAPSRKTTMRLNAISDRYLKTMGIPLISGRDFSPNDSNSSAGVAIVNRSFARRLGLGDNPVGARFRAETAPSEMTFEIIGLVPDTKYFQLREDPVPTAFLPIGQIPDPRSVTDLMIRLNIPLGDFATAISHTIDELNPRIAVDVRWFNSTIRENLLPERLMAVLSSFFGVLGMIIATVGVYGVMSYFVARRTNEIGIRVALGAQRTDIMILVMRQAGRLVALGLILGMILVFAVAGLMRPFVFGIQPLGAEIVGLAVILLAAVAAAASYFPARRAANVDPFAALRQN